MAPQRFGSLPDPKLLPATTPIIKLGRVGQHLRLRLHFYTPGAATTPTCANFHKEYTEFQREAASAEEAELPQGGDPGHCVSFSGAARTEGGRQLIFLT